jgi:hypothetical protein
VHSSSPVTENCDQLSHQTTWSGSGNTHGRSIPKRGGHQMRVKSWGRTEKRHGNRPRSIVTDTEDSGIGARFIGMILMSDDGKSG